MNKSVQVGNWYIRFRSPGGVGPHPVIWLMHGWTGDENSMWIFADRFPERYLLLAPRGLYPVEMGGYSWSSKLRKDLWPRVSDFDEAVSEIDKVMREWPEDAPQADFSKFQLVGFSQGGAFAAAYAMRNSNRTTHLSLLASFLPEDYDKRLGAGRFDLLRVFISHGSRDQIVPIEKGRRAVRILSSAGAKVTYCESDAGHKLSAGCFRGFKEFVEEAS